MDVYQNIFTLKTDTPQQTDPRLAGAPRSAWVEVDLGAISRNIDRIQARLAPGSSFCAVVKANGYGHGQAEAMKLLMKKGISRFAVATVSEAILARTLCPDGMVYMLGIMQPEDFDIAIDYRITLNISDLEDAKALSGRVLERWKDMKERTADSPELSVSMRKQPVFAVVNTGMNRIGFDADDPGTIEKIREIASLPGLELLGLMSHFSSSDGFDEAGNAYTAMQLARFEKVRKTAEEAGIPLPFNTLANSAASLLLPESHYQMARPGGAIFGDYADGLPPDIGIEYCMNVKAKIMLIQELPEGSAISYGRRTVLRRKSLIATLPLGYADGIPRAWSCEKGYVLLHGKKAPIVGVVCMDQMMIDVTDIPEARRFDTVTLIGKDGEYHITPEEVGAVCGGIFDTTVIGMAQRLPYRYING